MSETSSQSTTTRLFNNKEVSTIIINYLNRCKVRSEDTYNNYVSRFNDFFTVVTGKEISLVTWQDVLQITYNDGLLYQEYLKGKNNSNKTINEKISALHTLFKHLARHGKSFNMQLDSDILNLERLDECEHDKKSYGSLSEQEVNNLFSFCTTRNYKPMLQKLFFETLFITLLRRDCILNLNISQLSQIEDNSTKKLVYVLKTSQKRSDDITAIPDNLALELQKFADKETGRIFNIQIATLRLTLTKFCEQYNISEDRNITIHSLKKAGVNYVYENSNYNIVQTSQAAHHKDINTTVNSYMKTNNKLTEQLSYSTHQTIPTIENLKSLSKEELLNLIEKSGTSTIRLLLNLMDSGKCNNNSDK